MACGKDHAVGDLVFMVDGSASRRTADHIDPEEVPDNYAEILQKRLDKAFGESLEGELFLVSAKLALDSALQKNASLWEQSGMEVLTARLREIFAAERAGIRDSRLQWQYRRICGRIYRRLTSEKCLMGMKGSALEAARDSLGQLIASRGEAPHHPVGGEVRHDGFSREGGLPGQGRSRLVPEEDYAAAFLHPFRDEVRETFRSGGRSNGVRPDSQGCQGLGSPFPYGGNPSPDCPRIRGAEQE